MLRVYSKGFEEVGFREFHLLRTLKEKNVKVSKVYFFDSDDEILKIVTIIIERIEGFSAAEFLNDEKIRYNYNRRYG